VNRPFRLALIVAVATGTAAALVAGCSSSPASPGAPSPSGAASSGSSSLAPATLKLSSLQTYQPGMDRVVADFEKAYPQVKINVSYYQSGDPYTTTVSTQFSAGNGPDIVMMAGGRASPVSVTAFARAGYLADLSGQPWVAGMYAPTKSNFQFGGKVYARDLGLSPLAAISYNQDYFNRHHIAVPTTFAQLLGVCKTISAQGKVPISWGAGTQAVNSNNLVTIAGGTVFASDPGWLARAEAGRTTFASTAGWRDAVQEIADMKTANCFSPGVAGVPVAQMVSDFAGGSAEMMWTYGGSDGLVLQQTPGLKIGMFAPPAPDAADSRVTVQAYGALGVNAKSPSQAQAEAFLNFVSSPAELRAYCSLNQLISGTDAAAGRITGVYAGLKPYFTGNKVLGDPTAQWPSTSMNTNAGASLQGLFTGQKSVSQVLSDLDTYLKAS
jgi:raffinose/stachyose/melibiose transport system substrate-binding protein